MAVTRKSKIAKEGEAQPFFFGKKKQKLLIFVAVGVPALNPWRHCEPRLGRGNLEVHEWPSVAMEASGCPGNPLGET